MPTEMNSESPVPAIGGCAAARPPHSGTGAFSRVLATVAALVAGCTPTLDWRTVPLPDTALIAQMPCRPARFQRDVVVAGVPLKLFMLSCEADGVTYGVATADVGDPTHVDAVLEALAASARAALRPVDARLQPFGMAGATPFRGNVGGRLRGVRPDGQAVEESLRLFGRGSRVFQVSAIGSTLADQATRPFEDGLAFDLENHAADPR